MDGHAAVVATSGIYTMAAAPVIILVQAFLSRAVSCAAAALPCPDVGDEGALN